jgi:hypothetical protein
VDEAIMATVVAVAANTGAFGSVGVMNGVSLAVGEGVGLEAVAV